MLLQVLKYHVFCSLFIGMSMICQGQIGGLGGALLNVNFGSARTDDLTAGGPNFQQGTSAFSFNSGTCPSPNSYSIVSGINPGCNTGALIDLFADNTPFPDANGYMMLLSDMAHPTPKTIYEYSLGACYDVDYQFAASIINLDKPTSTNCHRFSSITLEVRDGSGVLLGTTTTGDMQFAVYNMGYHFTRYAVNFRLGAGNTLPITVRIIDEPKALSNCNNFVGIDDINVVVTGSRVNIVFDSTPVGYWVKSACFQNNQQFTMLGTIETTLSNPAVQWEQSRDDGITWNDIPGATGYTLVQNFSVVDTFLFRLRAADRLLISQRGCGVSSDVLKVQVDGIPRVHSATSNSPVCAGNELKLDAEGGAQYEWRGPNGFYDNVKFPGIYRAALKDSGWYYADIISAGGCRVTDSTFVKMIGSDGWATPDTAICIGGSVQLNTSEARRYSWTPAEGLSNPNIRQPIAKPVKTTTYSLALGDANGCNSKASVTIVVKNAREVKATIAAPKYICRQTDSIRFISVVQGDSITARWDFGDGGTSNELQPAVRYYANIAAGITNYSVQLTVTDTAGCTDRTTHHLQVADLCNLAVPNAFSPNGDGVNEYFWPLNAFKAIPLHFVVFNRNGFKIFETSEWPGKWDGTYKGQPQDAGTYVWLLEYQDATGKKQVKKGTVTLIR